MAAMVQRVYRPCSVHANHTSIQVEVVSVLFLIAAERHTVAPAFLLVPIAVLAGLWLLWAYVPRDEELFGRDALPVAFVALLRLVDQLVLRYQARTSSHSHQDRDVNARGPLGQE